MQAAKRLALWIVPGALLGDVSTQLRPGFLFLSFFEAGRLRWMSRPQPEMGEGNAPETGSRELGRKQG
ncbi:MAG: hypothetical protein DRH11_16195 [Deltaproteobacteria bacterium]|nr:hypothetical protein [Deltaproteobacteria bacterium]MBW1930289.1 hypothetical protein [Deltaproteobacteria bacterium]RLB29281.1 MAG: hypothetical protein DRH11_16195 [Deltaproteobacteria bacterium]